MQKDSASLLLIDVLCLDMAVNVCKCKYFFNFSIIKTDIKNDFNIAIQYYKRSLLKSKVTSFNII